MKRVMLALTILMMFACNTIPVPTPKPPVPPVMALAWDMVACVKPVVMNYCDGTTALVTITPNPPNGSTPRVQTTDANGYTMVSGIPASWQGVDVDITADGYVPLHTHTTTAALITQNATLCNGNPCHNTFELRADLPTPPTRDQLLNVHITFQGLDVVTQQFGTLPGFEAALPWLTPIDRQAFYAAKHASQAWGPGGDTHALVFLPSGPPLYDEPNQPYSADRFGPLDWTAGNTKIDSRLSNLVHEVITNGFPSVLLFLGGDDGSTCAQVPTPPQCGYVIAMRQLDLVHAALIGSTYGNLIPYVVPFPGFDGVFYGYTPDQVKAWGAKCRTLFLYCGFEQQTGHIPTGNGDGDWTGNGGMRAFDLLLSEFDDDRFDDSVWQIAARLLGPAYMRPTGQPINDDPPPVPFYLREPTDRGPIRNCAFEFGLYGQVLGAYNANHVNTAQRPYFKNVGYTCGG